MNLLKSSLCFAAATALLSGLAACDSMIYDHEGDCEVIYRLHLRYDRNMLWADATARHVRSVKIVAFDADGRQVWSRTAPGDEIVAEDFTFTLPLEAGDYRILAWCGVADDNSSFTLPDARPTASVTDHHCRMIRTTEGDTHISDRDLLPLFHGEMDLTLPASPDDGATFDYTLPLTKDTNVVRVVLQNLSGETLSTSDFDFAITDNNGHLGHDNIPVNTHETISYRPWSVQSGSTDINATPGRVTSVSAVVAEMTVSRLMADSRARLTVTNRASGRIVASIPVVDYALLVKGNYNRTMTDQEYLDRQDEYNMTFFIDETGSWLSSTVIINSWRVVINNGELGISN